MRRLEIRLEGEIREVDVSVDADIAELKAAIRPRSTIILKDKTGRTWLDCFDVSDIPEDVELEATIDRDEDETDGEKMSDMFEQTKQQLKKNPELLKQVLENPVIQQLLGDPKKLQTLIDNNPSLHSLPGMKTILESPERLKRVQAVASNPRKFQEVVQNKGPILRSMLWHLRPFPWIAESAQMYVL